jgi:hypothetical protein
VTGDEPGGGGGCTGVRMGSWVVFLGAGFGLTGLNSVSMKFLVCVDLAACSAFVPAGDEKSNAGLGVPSSGSLMRFLKRFGSILGHLVDSGTPRRE